MSTPAVDHTRSSNYKDQLIAELRKENAELRKENAELRKENAELKQRVKELEQKNDKLIEMVRERLASVYGRQVLTGRCIPIWP